ncbi:MAG: SulP family inorganic anion transporter [Verrucomicrobiota bacterium]
MNSTPGIPPRPAADSESGTPQRPWKLRLFQGILPLNRSRILPDATAGLTLAAMNIPQALGYTKIAGMPVVTGLYTLLLPVVAFAVFGSSRYLVVAADSATAAILAGGLADRAAAASPDYVALAGLVALLTAGYLILARVFRLGFLADFLSQTVLVGFLTGVGFQVGIAVLGQMLEIPVTTHRTLDQLATIARGLPEAHGPAAMLSAAIVAVILFCRRFLPRAPGPLIAVAGAVAASAAFNFSAHGITVLGPVAGGLPGLALPSLHWKEIVSLLPVAGGCFVMIVAQSAATARAYALRHHQVLDENSDLAGLSAANAAAALSGTFVVNGSPTQTGMVERSGGSSQVSHLATAAAVAVVLLFFTGPLQFLPHCVLGAVVFTIAIGLVDVPGLRAIARESPGEFRLALVTAAVVVCVGVEQGILLAMALSLLRHVRHSYRPHTAVLTRDSNGAWRLNPAVPGAVTEPGLVVFQFGADLFYANADHFTGQVRSLVQQAPMPIRRLVLDGGAITGVDYSATQALRQLHSDLAAAGVTLMLVHAPGSLLDSIRRHHLEDVFRPELTFDTLREVMAAIHKS